MKFKTFLAIISDPAFLRVFENTEVKVYRLFRVLVEPKVGADFLV